MKSKIINTRVRANAVCFTDCTNYINYRILKAFVKIIKNIICKQNISTSSIYSGHIQKYIYLTFNKRLIRALLISNK